MIDQFGRITIALCIFIHGCLQVAIEFGELVKILTNPMLICPPLTLETGVVPIRKTTVQGSLKTFTLNINKRYRKF